MNEKIKKIWSEELGHEINDESDFFEMGGHSLIMIKVQSRIRKDLGLSIPMDQLFIHSKLSDLVRYIMELKPVNQPEAVTGQRISL